MIVEVSDTTQYPRKKKKVFKSDLYYLEGLMLGVMFTPILKCYNSSLTSILKSCLRSKSFLRYVYRHDVPTFFFFFLWKELIKGMVQNKGYRVCIIRRVYIYQHTHI